MRLNVWVGRPSLENNHCFLFNDALLASGDYLILVAGENQCLTSGFRISRVG